jgi:phosphoribosyl 1,2-cyclic phosphodiesterase
MIFAAHHSGSSANLYTVSSAAGETLLLEAGLPAKQIKKALKYRLSAIQAALITHSHADHCKGAAGLMFWGLDVYCTEPTATAAKLKSTHRLHIIEPQKQFNIGNWKILPFETQHDCPGSVGYYIQNAGRRMVFITDSFYCRYRFPKLNIIAIECNWDPSTLAPNLASVVKKRLHKSHFNLDRVIRFLKATDLSRVEAIYLIHLSEGNSDELLFKTEVAKATGVPVYVCAK